MLELKSIQFVRSVAGRIGGFELAKPPEEITMGQIVRHFDGIIAPISCVSASSYEPCSQETTCRFRRIMLDIRNFSLQMLDEASLSAVYNVSPVDESEVFDLEFIGGDGI